RTHGSLEDYSDNQSYLMDSFMKSLNLNHQVQAFFVYELLDQPALKGMHDEFEQSQYGIYNWGNATLNSNDLKPKQVSDVIKLNIEEAMNGSENYIYSVFQKLLMKEPDSAELKYWSNQLKNSNNLESFLNFFLAEHQINFHNEPTQNLSGKERKEISGEK